MLGQRCQQRESKQWNLKAGRVQVNLERIIAGGVQDMPVLVTVTLKMGKRDRISEAETLQKKPVDLDMMNTIKTYIRYIYTFNFLWLSLLFVCFYRFAILNTDLFFKMCNFCFVSLVMWSDLGTVSDICFANCQKRVSQIVRRTIFKYK